MRFKFSLMLLLLLSAKSFSDQPADKNWIAVGGDRGCQRYSSLKQINKANVAKLEAAWNFHTGELNRQRKKTIECTPLIIEGKMYITTGHLRVVALDAETGEELWNFDPFENHRAAGPLASGGVNRGLAYWSDNKEGGLRRIIHGTSDGRLFSLIAESGKLDTKFGTAGVKDLREDLDRDISKLGYGPTSAPAICGENIIIGVSNGEGPGEAAPGDIRAFDVRTGEQTWRFHTVPREGEFGNETWAKDSWKNRGGANAWGGLSVDEDLGMVFAGLGSAAFDFYGGDRHGDNLFANCTIALDAKTGQRRWHYQTLRHDLWDHDLPIYPNLVTVEHHSEKIPAVAQITKTGYVFLFDRITGRPLFEIEDKIVPSSDVPGEKAAKTQPIPVKPPPFAVQHFDESNVTDIGEENREYVLKLLENIRSGQSFLPPSLEGSVVIPGYHGGANWSGASYDPQTGLLYINSNNVPNLITLEKANPDARFAYRHKGYVQIRDQEGYPAIKPPWGVLTAINLNHGEIAWQVPLGEYEELKERGVPQTGTETFGGTIVTAGGLVFIAGTKDEKFRAFDKLTGEVLWEYQLPAGGYATPATYEVNGKQYVVIAAGGAGKLGTRAGDAFIAFTLPK